LADLKQVTIFTDGCCLGNPGPGGYGVVLKYKSQRKELSAGYRKTTNNRMELLAAIVALRALKERCKVTLYSDSKYVIDGMAKGWAAQWKANGWMRNKKERAINPDLWEQLLSLAGQHDVTFQWVKGHAGNHDNERCDQLANQAAAGKFHLEDDVYESGKA
jgi:ribonuclease HI